jgi:predicted double-glycine peptidase
MSRRRLTRTKRLGFGSVLILFLGSAVPAATRETAGVWLDVPFVKQTEEGCGSASLSMLLQYWGAQGTAVTAGRADADTIQKKLYSRRARGIFTSNMQQYLEESGFRVFSISGGWDDLRQHLSKGRPLIISVQPGSKRAPFHYVVVTGMDWEHEAVFLNDPARGKLMRVERAEFEKEWRGAHNWMLLAVPETKEW